MIFYIFLWLYLFHIYNVVFSLILYNRASSTLSSKRYKVTVFGRNDKDKQRKDKREERGKGKENTRRASKEAKPEHNRA